MVVVEVVGFCTFDSRSAGTIAAAGTTTRPGVDGVARLSVPCVSCEISGSVWHDRWDIESGLWVEDLTEY